MKEKIFQLLKQAYKSLGLSDDVFLAHAELLDKMGIVTEDNVESVVENQKSFLESLQKENDRRVTEAQKKFQAEQAAKAKAEADRLKAEEDAKKAEEEKRLEELKKNDIPDYMKNFFDQQAKREKKIDDERKAEREEYKKQIDELTKSNGEQKTSFLEQFQKQNELISSLQGTIQKMQDEAKAKAEADAKAKVIAEHKNKILSKAKELGIPQSRIDEGFVIADDADDETINNVLTKVSNNYKALQQPQFGGGLRSNLDEKATNEQIENVAKALVDSL